METRASKKRAITAQQTPLVVVPKRQRVVLGEIPDLSFPQQYQPSLDSNLHLDKPVYNKNNSKRDNQQIIEPYVSDIFDYLRTLEKKRRPMVGYIENVQLDITSNMRGTLFDWLVEVADEYKLLPETLHLSVSYIDRFLSLNTLSRKKLQLLGVSSMLIAS
jgi:cyclin A